MLDTVMKRSCVCAVILGFGCALYAGEPDPKEPAGDQTEAIKALIAKLNAAEAIAREDAERELVRLGQAALPLLKEAVKAPQPEIAARAKRLVSRLAARPVRSYADVMPADSIFYLEAPHTRQTLDKMKGSPLGKLWDLPVVQKFYKGHREAQVPNDQKILDVERALPRLLDGKALMAIGSPETAEAAELDPPLVYVMESKQLHSLETQTRNLFEGMTDPPKTSRPYGPFIVEEHITAQTVFAQESIIHALTQKGIESFLDCIKAAPAKSLAPALKDIRALLPDCDFIYHVASDGFKSLAEAGQLIDDDQVETMDKLGFVSGSRWQGVVGVTADGFEEHLRITLGGGDKNEGLLAVLKKMAAAVPPPPAAGTPQALDLIPWQTGLLFSVQGDVGGNAAALAKALRAIDARTPPAPPPPRAQPGAAPGAVKPPTMPEQGAPKEVPGAKQPNTRGKEALAAGQGVDAAAGKQPGVPGGKVPAEEKAPAPPKPAVTYPRIERFERTGLKLEQFLEQAQGPVHVALFMQQVGDEAPDTAPISLLAAMMLKDAAPITQALDAASAGPQPRYIKEQVGGGVQYVEARGDPETKPGFWLKDKYLAYVTDRELLDYAVAALAHQAANERMSDRAAYKAVRNLLDPQALLTVYGEAEQVLEMPYRLSKVNWEEDAQGNPWPSYELIKPLLQNRPVLVQFTSIPEGLQGYARTPLTLYGMIEAFRRPFAEAGLW